VAHTVESLYATYHESLVRMLYRRTGDRDRAEDLAQEVFARALTTPPDNPRPWLFAVALNLVRDDGRRAVRQGRRLQLLKAESTTTSPGPDHDYEKEQQIRAVRAALKRQPRSAASTRALSQQARAAARRRPASARRAAARKAVRTKGATRRPKAE